MGRQAGTWWLTCLAPNSLSHTRRHKKGAALSSGPSPCSFSSAISELSQLFLTVEPQLTPPSLSPSALSYCCPFTRGSRAATRSVQQRSHSLPGSLRRFVRVCCNARAFICRNLSARRIFGPWNECTVGEYFVSPALTLRGENKIRSVMIKHEGK